MRLDNLSNLAVGHLPGSRVAAFQCNNIPCGDRLRADKASILRECVIILKCENSFIYGLIKIHGH